MYIVFLLATKEFTNNNDFEKINLSNLSYYNHLSIFISSSTITQFDKYEKGTINPKLRFDSFKLQSKYNIPMYLYIKPVLEHITIIDIGLYIQIIKQYNIEPIKKGIINV
jgi:DNA repair photolyase